MKQFTQMSELSWLTLLVNNHSGCKITVNGGIDFSIIAIDCGGEGSTFVYHLTSKINLRVRQRTAQ